ncbi:MAG: response regulator [Polyangiaceae bacterium]
MSPGSVLVIDDDEWVGRLLAVALREAGYEVLHSASAVSGYEQAVEKQPDCIICDVDLPDVDGFWVARKIRMSPERVSVTPFLFLSGLDDRDTRLQGFHVGADVYMTKPFRIDEVVAQVGALVQMAKRLRQHRRTFLSVPPMEAAMTGDLAQMSVATVLTLLDMERRSGSLEVSSKSGQATLTILTGAIGGATLNGQNQEPLELLRTLLAWNEGRFSFHPDATRNKTAQDTSINALLMEAVRLEDEKHATEANDATSEPPGSRRRIPRLGRITGEHALPSSVVPAVPRSAPDSSDFSPVGIPTPPPAAIGPRGAAARVPLPPPAPEVPKAPTAAALPHSPVGPAGVAAAAPAGTAARVSNPPGASTSPAAPRPARPPPPTFTPNAASVERAKLDQVLDELIPISLSPSSLSPESAGRAAPKSEPPVIESGWSEPPPAPAPPAPPPAPKVSHRAPPPPPPARKPTPGAMPAVAPRPSGVPRPAPTPKPVGAPVATKPLTPPTRQGSGGEK